MFIKMMFEDDLEIIISSREECEESPTKWNSGFTIFTDWPVIKKGTSAGIHSEALSYTIVKRF